MSLEEATAELNRIYDQFDWDFKNYKHFGTADAVSRLTLEEARVLASSVRELEISYMGQRSDFVAARKHFKSLSKDERKIFGEQYQWFDKTVRNAIFGAKGQLQNWVGILEAATEKIDVTLPGRRPRAGHLHPITILRQKIEDIFVSMGYAIEDDREIETDYYNFDALNIPIGHPARESQDTFYTTGGFALRSQTSTVQIRAMERRGVPIRILAPGKVYRRDTPDMTHTPMFHQLEGLCVDKGITMAHLKGTITEWVHRMFGEDTITRMRPSYFPFTEPSAEFDYSCFKCHGTGKSVGGRQAAVGSEDKNELPTAGREPPTDRCRPCKGSGWIELGGSGMVHPNVLRACGVDPSVYSGFAFGFGLERMCALMYSLDDIRLMFDNDVRFLEQFR